MFSGEGEPVALQCFANLKDLAHILPERMRGCAKFLIGKAH